MDVWNDGRHLRKNSEIGPEQITWGVMWEFVGGEKGKHVITVKDIRQHFGRDGSTIRTHFEKLAKIGVIDLIARTRTTGQFVIYVYNPIPAHAERVPDPQMVFPDFWTKGVDDISPFVADQTTKPATAERGQGGDAEGATRGNFPANPREDSRGTGTFPRESSRAEDSQNHGSADSTGNSQETGRGNFPAPQGGTPFAFVNDNDRSNRILSNGITNSKDNVSNVVFPDAGKSPRESSRGKVPADAEAAELEAYIESRRRAHAADEQADQRMVSKQRTIGDILLEKFDAPIEKQHSTAAQKRRLVARLKALVADPNTTEWLFGAAADLLVVHAQSKRADASAIYDAMNSLLQNMAAFREMEDRNGKTRKPLGKWLNKEFHKICDAHGITTSKRRKLTMAGAGR